MQLVCSWIRLRLYCSSQIQTLCLTSSGRLQLEGMARGRHLPLDMRLQCTALLRPELLRQFAGLIHPVGPDGPAACWPASVLARCPTCRQCQAARCRRHVVHDDLVDETSGETVLQSALRSISTDRQCTCVAHLLSPCRRSVPSLSSVNSKEFCIAAVVSAGISTRRRIHSCWCRLIPRLLCILSCCYRHRCVVSLLQRWQLDSRSPASAALHISVTSGQSVQSCLCGGVCKVPWLDV
jgi:hypothetical protein